MRYREIVFKFNGTEGSAGSAAPWKEWQAPPVAEKTDAKTTESVHDESDLGKPLPWTAMDGFLNMGLIPVLCLAGALWALRTRNLWAFIGFAVGGATLVGAAFIKYGDAAYGGLIANIFVTGAVFAAVGIVVALFGSMVTSLFKRED